MAKKPKIFDYFVLVYKPSHPRAVAEGYVPEHYLVAEKGLGRYLSPDEDVRHKNGNAQDNRASNLEIISLSADYRSRSVGGHDVISERKPQRNYMPCKFQRPCWKEVRAPLARKHKIYMPHICSFQTEGGRV